MKLLELSFAARNLSRQGVRTLTTLAIMVVGVLVLQLVGGFYESMFQGLETDVIRQEGHLWIKIKEEGKTLDRSLDKALEASGLFSQWVYRRELSGLLGTEDRSAVFSGLVLDPAGETLFRSWGKDSPEPYRIQTGPQLAKNLGIDQGGLVSGFALDQGFSFPVDRIEPTVSTDLDRFYQEVPLSTFFWPVEFTSLHLQWKPGVRWEEVREVLGPLVPPEEFIWQDYRGSGSYFSAVKGIYQSNFQFILGVICLSVLFSVANSLVMALLERRKEIGTIRSFGAPAAHLHRLIFWESLILGLAAWLAGTLMAWGIGILVNSLGGWYLDPPPTVKEGLRLFYIFHLPAVGISGAVVLGVTLLTGQVVGLTTHRQTIMNQLI